MYQLIRAYQGIGSSESVLAYVNEEDLEKAIYYFSKKISDEMDIDITRDDWVDLDKKFDFFWLGYEKIKPMTFGSQFEAEWAKYQANAKRI